ncbi:MAG: energy coupling factor transporter S component ThiW [Clostridia bacterium]|nr:energy coupling factor transporter S component ThiW [Clostridia bacterium]
MKTKKLVTAGLLIALAVVGSTISFPVLGSKCSPVQHMVNVIAAVALGPWYGIAMAFIASVIRIAFGLGTFMAFPGSMCGALLAGILYKVFKKLPFACIGELFGTSVIGGLLAYPVAYFIMGNESAVLFGYIIPFLISSAGGTIIAAMVVIALKRTSVLDKFAM